jgi:NitT/TauT family transport system substrate-binding protein
MNTHIAGDDKTMGKRAGLLLAAVTMMLACGACAPPAPRSEATKNTFNMSWLPQGSMVGVIVAIDKGFYAAHGLDVSAVRGFGGTRTTNEVDQGMFDFGYGDPLSVVLNRANGGQARLVGVINQRWPAGLCYLRGRHSIKTPADLVGLSIGGGQNSAVQTLLPLWMRRNGVDPATVKILQLNPSVIVTSLVEGKIDAAECWRGNSRPLFAKQAQEAGQSLAWLEYGDFNLDIYGSGLITTDRMIAERPAVVQGFVSATYQGYAYAAQHQDEARDIMIKTYPLLDRAVTAQQINEITELLAGSGAPGSATQDKMARTLEFIASAQHLESKLSAESIYTNQFVVRH